MKRTHVLTFAGLAATTAVLAVTASGSAQSSGGQTLTFFETNKGATFHFVDLPPRSRRRQAISVGDEVFFGNAVLDHQGGTRIGTTYGTGVFVKGTRVSNGLLLGQGVIRLAGGDIVIKGLFRATDAPHTDTVAVIGGTGRFAGARGQFTTRETSAGSQDTVELLP